MDWRMTENDKIRIGKCLKRLRELRKLTIPMVCDTLDVTEEQIKRWESGKISKESSTYVNYIYWITKHYNGHTVPQYFIDYYQSDDVQDYIRYTKTVGYAFRYMRSKVMKKTIRAVAKESGLQERNIEDIEKNTYIGKDKQRIYAVYILNKTGNRCNYKIVKIAGEMYLK